MRFQRLTLGALVLVTLCSIAAACAILWQQQGLKAEVTGLRKTSSEIRAKYERLKLRSVEVALDSFTFVGYEVRLGLALFPKGVTELTSYQLLEEFWPYVEQTVVTYLRDDMLSVRRLLYFTFLLNKLGTAKVRPEVEEIASQLNKTIFNDDFAEVLVAKAYLESYLERTHEAGIE